MRALFIFSCEAHQAFFLLFRKHLLQELWKTFERDGQVPIEASGGGVSVVCLFFLFLFFMSLQDPESRSVREMFKWLGSQPAYHWL